MNPSPDDQKERENGKKFYSREAYRSETGKHSLSSLASSTSIISFSRFLGVLLTIL